MMNETTIVRKTAETDITLTLARGTGKAQHYVRDIRKHCTVKIFTVQ